MASDTDQLTTDFEKVQSTLEVYPRISIIQIEGQPPDSYEIEYQLKGYVHDTDGQIRQASQHRIRVNLPFGYPHFPPTVKPLSPIFHPDIDPDAIRITAHWKENPSLPDLLLHIGEMICGNIYNLEDPFNQEAADWYAEHLDELPLDSLQVADIAPADDQLEDLADDSFDLLGLEDEEPPENLQTTEQQLDLIRLRIEQKEMFAAGRLLAEIPAATPVTDRDEIDHVISAALRESSKLLQQAGQLEEKGKIDKALETVQRVAEIAADTPDLDDMRLRLQQSQVMSESFAEATDIPESSDSSSPVESIASTATSKQDINQQSVQSRVPRISIPNLPSKPILAAALILALAAGGAGLYFRDTSSLKKAETALQQASDLARKKQYKKADQYGQTALTALDKVVIMRSQKKRLQDNISTLLNATAFKKGLLGQTQYKDQYLPNKTVAQLQQLDKLTGEAEKISKTETIDKALAAYDTALHFAQKNDLQSQAQTLSQTMNNLRFKEAMSNAGKAESAKEWQNAAATYRRALEISKTLSNVEGTGEISKKLAAATFRHELDQSKATFTEAQWQQTIEMLVDAKKILDENPDSVSSEEREELDRLLADAHLYQMLSLARQAYENHKWDLSIKEYRNALDLLREKQHIFAGAHDNAVAKIKKTMLMIRITDEQNGATAAERNNNLETALAHYKTIKELITTSEFSEDKDIVTVEENVDSQIKDKSAQLTMETRINWLKENFTKIFNDAYPSSSSSKLSRPKITFVREKNGKQLFRMTCVERSQSSSFRLEVKYQYDLASGAWSIYYDQ